MHCAMKEYRSRLFSADYSSAEQIAHHELRIRPSAEWQNALGLLHLAQGRFAEALQCYDKALELNAGHIEALLNGAIVLADLGFYDEAAERFRRAQTADLPFAKQIPNDQADSEARDGLSLSMAEKIAEMHVELGQLYAQFGKWENAEQEHVRARSISDDFATTMSIAQFHFRWGHPQLALDCVTGVDPRCDSEAVELLCFKAQCLVKLDKNDSAQDALSQALRFQPSGIPLGELLRQACARDAQ